MDLGRYEHLRDQSTRDLSTFWLDQARQRLTWHRLPTRGLDGTLGDPTRPVRWFADGQLNVTATCLDRHLAERSRAPALLVVANDPGPARVVTYGELHQQVVSFAAALRRRGIRPGDRVVLYLPMVAETIVAMLAIARVGAVHSVVFGGFSARALRDRIQDCGARWIITADQGPRGATLVPLKATVDEALQLGGSQVQGVVVLKRTGHEVPWQPGRDIPWDEWLAGADPSQGYAEIRDAEDPLFVLYTSGSTGKPKGLLHTCAGYLTYATATFDWVFDYRPGEVYWCTADVGWITGHSYLVYGPLAAGATVLVYEGTPTFPTASRFWQIIAENRVNIFYTAPTALRSLMRLGDGPLAGIDLSSLRILGSVGEPINPRAWEWYHSRVGRERCPIVDTWWQTETGGIMISPIPGITKLVPGSATQPLFGVCPELVDPASGAAIRPPSSDAQQQARGALTLTKPWPGMARSIWGDDARYYSTYFAPYPGRYFTGDGAELSATGDFTITGRIDDVINVSGHRIGTFEVESALVSHPDVAEAAVIGTPHDIKGQSLYAFVTLKEGVAAAEPLRQALVQHVRHEIGPIATPDMIQWAPALPKTRSGKIMRRVLRCVATDDLESLGDTSTLADPTVVDALSRERLAALGERGHRLRPG